MEKTKLTILDVSKITNAYAKTVIKPDKDMLEKMESLDIPLSLTCEVDKYHVEFSFDSKTIYTGKPFNVKIIISTENFIIDLKPNDWEVHQFNMSVKPSTNCAEVNCMLSEDPYISSSLYIWERIIIYLDWWKNHHDTKITCAQILKLLNDYKLWDGITFRPFNTFQFAAHGIGGRYAIIKGKDPMEEDQWYVFTQTGKLILKIDKNIVDKPTAAFITYALDDIDENGCKPYVTSFLDDDINTPFNVLENICSEETKQALEDIRKIFRIIVK